MNRVPNSRARTTVLGTDELNRALENARDKDSLQKFCSAHACTSEQVSENGTRLYLPHVLQLMRSRGYQVSDPVRAPHQPKRGFTAWIVHIRVTRAEFDLGFYTPDAGKAGPAKKPQPANLEHA